MDKLKAIDWSKLVDNKHLWVDTSFSKHIYREDKKAICRFFPVEFSGTQQETMALAESMAESIASYVFDEKQIKFFENNKKVPFQKAMKFFGTTNPDMDGKYGELLLYILTEKYLKTPLVSHKLSLLTNTNDQVKGGDGIFLGGYKEEIAILIGESKIHKQQSKALDDALLSISRFYENYDSGQLSHELFIARSNISDNFSSLEDLDSLYNAFTPGTTQYKECVKAHPVLLVYEAKKINKIEEESKNKQDAEEQLNIWIESKANNIFNTLNAKLNSYPELKKVYLDIFMIPLNNVSNFKHALYKEIHGVGYKK